MPMLPNVAAVVDEFEDFFGAPPQDVEPIPRMIWQMYRVRRTTWPDWLRHCRKISDLPRYNDGAMETRGIIAPMTVSGRAEHIIWIIEHLQGPWCADGLLHFHFTNDVDRVIYRLSVTNGAR